MSTMLERMKAAVAERQKTFTRDNSIYPFWNLKFGSSVTVRFLPYSDKYTGAFWAEKVLLPMQFSDPEDDTKVIKFSAPCLEMYDHREKCPLLGPIRDLYSEAKELKNSGQTKDAERLEKIAGFHWKKPTYYYQGFIVKGGFEEDETPENPIRVFPFNKKIHRLIYDSIFANDEDPFEFLPCGEYTEADVQSILDGGEVDMETFNGYNFIVKKMQQGEWADWTTASGWSKSTSPLETEHLAAIAEHGFFDLTQRLPDRPTSEQYDVLLEMMNISITRQLSGENGVWQKDWEELGFKPFRQGGAKAADGEGESKPTSSARSASASSNAEKAGGASNALEKLKAAREKAASEEAPEPETAADVAAEADTVSEPEAATGETEVSDLSARIKARIGKSA